MNNSRLLRKPLLRAPLSAWAAFFRQRQTQINNADPSFESLLLYHPRLSSFLNHKQGFDQDEVALIFGATVDLGLFRIDTRRNGYQIKRPCVALDTQNNASLEKSQLFTKTGIPYIVLPNDPAEFEQHQLKGIEKRWLAPATKNRYLSSALDRDEPDNIAHLEQLLRPLKLEYFPQQGLSDMLEVTPVLKEYIHKRISDFRDQHRTGPSRSFHEWTTVDGVIATPPPASIPIAVIEFDGTAHRQLPTAIERDKKSLKDQLKNRILSDAKIPLIRFAHGRDIGVKTNESAWRILESLLRKMQGLIRDDVHQALAMQEMVLTEVRALDGPSATNIESLITTFIDVLSAKGEAVADRFAAHLSQESSAFDPYEYIDHHNEPAHSLEGFTSDAAYSEAIVYGYHDYSIGEGPEFVLRFYDRRQCLVLDDSAAAWRLSVEYKRKLTEFDRVNKAILSIPETLTFLSSTCVPLRVFGSDLVKQTLDTLIYNFLRAERDSFEVGIYEEHGPLLKDALDEAQSSFKHCETIAELQRCSSFAIAIRHIEKAVGLHSSSLIAVSSEDQDNDAADRHRTGLATRRDTYIRALRESGRDDFDPEEIDLLRNELTDKIEQRVQDLEFWVSSHYLLRDFHTDQPTWKLGARPTSLHVVKDT